MGTLALKISRVSRCAATGVYLSGSRVRADIERCDLLDNGEP
jgi:hypothetical protein